MTALPDPRLPRHAPHLAAQYLASGAWSAQTTVARFRAVAEAHSDREAVAGLDGSLTYKALDERSDQVAVWLVEAGIDIGAPVVMQATNSAETVVVFYALLKAGAVPVAALAAHRTHEVSHISAIVDAKAHVIDATVSDGALIDVARSNARLHPQIAHLFTVGPAPEGFVRLAHVGSNIPVAEARSRIDAVQARIDHQDVAVFQLSGGTTGTPKVIPRLHAEYWNNGLFNSRALGRTSQSRIAHVMPILHNAGVLNALIGAHAVGGCVLALPFRDADETLNTLIATGVNDMMIGSPMVDWLTHPLWDELAAKLNVLIFSGSKLTDSVIGNCASRGVWLGQTWGMAEGPYTSTHIDDPADLRAEFVGTPIYTDDDELLIVDVTTHEPLPVGETGLLVYRGPSTLAGYFDAPLHNEVAFTDSGHFITGDLAKAIEHQGRAYLSIEGRIKDVISRGGEKFSTEEVEKLLLSHPAVVEAAVVAMPDARLGERACAYLVTAPGARPVTLSGVQEHFATLGVAKFKWPERLEFIDALPRTPTYKVDKLRLRGLIADKVTQEGQGEGARDSSSPAGAVGSR